MWRNWTSWTLPVGLKNGTATLENSWGFLKMLKIRLACNPAVPPPAVYSRKFKIYIHTKYLHRRGAWVAQSVKHSTFAQVVISQLVRLSPASGCVLTAQSLEPALDSVSPSLSDPSPLTLCLSLSLKNK